MNILAYKVICGTQLFFYENKVKVGELLIDEESDLKKIYNFRIYEDHRRKGFGLKAIEKTIAYIKRKYKEANVWLYVEKNNTPAVKIYNKVGFKGEPKLESPTYSMTLTV